MPLYRKKNNIYNVRIFSDHNIKSTHQFNIDVHSNIITIMNLLKQFYVGNVHAIVVQYSRNTIEASSLLITNMFNITNKHPHSNTNLSSFPTLMFSYNLFKHKIETIIYFNFLFNSLLTLFNMSQHTERNRLKALSVFLSTRPFCSNKFEKRAFHKKSNISNKIISAKFCIKLFYKTLSFFVTTSLNSFYSP